MNINIQKIDKVIIKNEEGQIIILIAPSIISQETMRDKTKNLCIQGVTIERGENTTISNALEHNLVSAYHSLQAKEIAQRVKIKELTEENKRLKL